MLAIDQHQNFARSKTASAQCLQAFILCLIIFVPFLTFSQNSADSNVIDISTIRYAKPITQNIDWFSGSDKTPDDSIPFLPFSEKLPPSFSLVIPIAVVEKNVYLRFSLANHADSANTVFFYPGMYCKMIGLFSADTSGFAAMTDSAGNRISISGFMPLRLAAHEQANIYAKLKLLRTGINGLSPRLISKDFLTYFKNNQQFKRSPVNLFTYIVSGILLMMLFYSLSVYFQNFNREFLYYAGYVFFTAGLLFIKSVFLVPIQHSIIFLRSILTLSFKAPG